MITHTPKTDDQLIQFGHAINSRVSEFFDGHIVVGITADTGEPVIITDGRPRDAMTVQLLKALMAGAGSQTVGA